MAAMMVYKVLLLISSVGSIFSTEFSHLNKLKAKTSSGTQEQAVQNLIIRTVGSRSSDFAVVVDPTLGPDGKDTFQIMSKGNQIEISGTTGVAVSMGFYYYLKYFCNAQKTWAGQHMDLSPPLPPVIKPIKVTTPDRYRYYQNVCTLSYTMAFWNWTRWEQEIDWMALRGINLPLAFIGQEAIFQRVYLNLGFNQTDLDNHFGGPAFLAWSRMGNIHAWGGPLPQMWITQKLVLQHQILDRMRSLGMTPVLPGFAGHVPAAITRVFPQAKYSRLGSWGHFNATFSATYLLDFHDPLFKKIGVAFIQTLINEFGTDHIYNADTFNEMTPASSDPAYLSAAGKSVFEGMITGDPKAVWLMQGWTFGDKFWGTAQVKALVTSVPQGRMIILDLAAEVNPLYFKFSSYYGQPFIWCMLHNFGGTMELYGALDPVSKGPFLARAYPNSTMIGTGITPEGIHQNEIMYEFMSEHAWRSELWDIDQWVAEFAGQRYGTSDPLVFQAWHYLQTTVYNSTDGHSDGDRVLITERPKKHFDMTEAWFNNSDFFIAWDKFIAASNNHQQSQLFSYDLVDITRNSLQLVALKYYDLIIEGLTNKNVTAIKTGGSKLCDLLEDMDMLLSSNDRFLLGTWQTDAIRWATDTAENRLYHYNARNQITLWGPMGEIHDYASKQWAGVMKDFYKPRFAFFANWLQQLVVNGTRWDSYIFNEKLMAAVETPWTQATYIYPTKPIGNPFTIAQALHIKYRPETQSSFFTYLESQRQKRAALYKGQKKNRWVSRKWKTF